MSVGHCNVRFGEAVTVGDIMGDDGGPPSVFGAGRQPRERLPFKIVYLVTE